MKRVIKFLRKKRKEGFTLIELLAIIVILAIIAVITVPIILNIIDNAKAGSVKDSAYGYKDAIVNRGVSSQILNTSGSFENKNYSADDLKSAGVVVSGEEPDENSWVSVVNNDIVDGCLQYGEYMVIVEHGYVGEPVKGQCDEMVSWTQSIFPTVLKKDGNTIYYDSNWIKANPIYYNPVSNSKCEASSSSSALGTSTGCMKWYAYSESDGKVNMLLDHNIVNNSVWNFDGLNNSIDEVISEIGELTDGWNDRLVRRDSYAAKWTSGNTEYSLSVSYNGIKARLISAEEVSSVVENYSWTKDGNKYFFGSGSDVVFGEQSEAQQLKQESNAWLFDNTEDCAPEGCEHEQTGVLAYWTSTPKTNTTDHVWCVCNGGCLDGTATDVAMGIRPVISVPKSIIY